GCVPASLPLDDTTTCTVKVTDTDSGSKSAPLGTAGFTRSGMGTTRGSACSLVAGGDDYSTCTVTYVPTAAAGTHTIKASYAASDSRHTNSADTGGFAVTVPSLHDALPISGCVPASLPLDDTTTCTVKVTDTDSGSKSAPLG